jgi:hypothetical protein
MKSSPWRLVVLFALIGGAGRLAAGPVEDGIVAAMNLSERPNYSWLSVVDDDARSYEIKGQTSREGFTRIRMPVINAIRRRLGRETTDNVVDAIYHGNVDCVFATDNGWKRLAELPPPPEPKTPLLRPGGVRGLGLVGVMEPKPPKVDEENETQPFSNLQPGITHPHEEIGVLISSGTNWRAEGDSLSGSLNELGVQLMLVRDGHPEITPEGGKGSFTIWIRDGLVYRYKVRLSGVLAIKTAKGIRRVSVKQNTTTLIQNVGSTQVNVPEEVRQRFVH